jgi:hypothetical protein
VAVGNILDRVWCGIGECSSPLARCGTGRRSSLLARCLPLLVCSLFLAACGGGAGGPDAGGDEAHDRLVGAWRAEFTPAAANAPFTLRVQPHGGELSAVIERSGEEIPVRSIVRRDLVVTIRLEQQNVEVFAKMAPNGGSMSGFWRQQINGAVSELPFKAWRVEQEEGG